MSDHKYYVCSECDWEGEGVELTEEGECPECYTLLREEDEEEYEEEEDD